MTDLHASEFEFGAAIANCDLNFLPVLEPGALVVSALRSPRNSKVDFMSIEARVWLTNAK